MSEAVTIGRFSAGVAVLCLAAAPICLWLGLPLTACSCLYGVFLFTVAWLMARRLDREDREAA